MKHTTSKLRLGDITRFVSGGTPSKQVPRYWGGSTPWVSAKDLKSLHVDSSIDTLTDAGRDAASLVPRGTLLILVRGMTLFKSIPIGIASRELAINQDLKGLITNDAVSPEFLAYSLLAKESELLQMVEAAGHGTGRLDTDALKDVLVRVPSPPEQHQIASAIATWDTAIQKKEQLIAAKAKRKAALMAELLTGRRRLTGFQTAWRSWHLGELFRERVETNRKDLPLLSITREEGVVPRSSLERKDTSNADKSKYLRICPGDIGYNTMRMWQGVSALSHHEGVVSPAYTVCIPGPEIDGTFVSYLFKLPEVVHLFYRYSQGLTSDTWNLKFHHFAAIRVRIPEPDEQIAIASLLSILDEELALIKQQRDALVQQKRGLMHKLLTGQWRLPVQEAVN